MTFEQIGEGHVENLHIYISRTFPVTFLTILRILKICLVAVTLTFQCHQYAEINYCPKGPPIPNGIFIYVQYLGRGRRFGQKSYKKKVGGEQYVAKKNVCNIITVLQ